MRAALAMLSVFSIKHTKGRTELAVSLRLDHFASSLLRFRLHALRLSLLRRAV